MAAIRTPRGALGLRRFRAQHCAFVDATRLYCSATGGARRIFSLALVEPSLEVGSNSTGSWQNASAMSEPKRKPPTPAGAFWTRMGLAHFLSYPPAFAAAFAGVPLAMIVREHAVLTATSEDQAQRMVLEVCIAAGAFVYVLVHLYGIPWSRAAAAAARGEPGAEVRRARGWRIFLGATLATAFVSVTSALVGWAWLLV
jgi:hypothetical protein